MRRIANYIVNWLWSKIVRVPLQGHPEDIWCPAEGCSLEVDHDGPHRYVDPVAGGTMSTNDPRFKSGNK